jgi:hypothetical protein
VSARMGVKCAASLLHLRLLLLVPLFLYLLAQLLLRLLIHLRLLLLLQLAHLLLRSWKCKECESAFVAPLVFGAAVDRVAKAVVQHFPGAEGMDNATLGAATHNLYSEVLTMRFQSADSGVLEPGSGFVHWCTDVLPPLPEKVLSQRAQVKQNRRAAKMSKRTPTEVWLADTLTSFLTAGESERQHSAAPLSVDSVCDVELEYDLEKRKNAKDKKPAQSTFNAVSNFGFVSGHGGRQTKPTTMVLPAKYYRQLRRAFDKGNEKGASRRSAASVWKEVFVDTVLFVDWGLRMGCSSLRVKTLFSQWGQKKKKKDKSGLAAAAACAAGEDGVGGGEDGGSVEEVIPPPDIGTEVSVSLDTTLWLHTQDDLPCDGEEDVL